MSRREPRATLLEDRRVGSYRLLRRLGRGATGEVWLGESAESGALAAVKTVRDPSRIAALHEEHRAIARLRHPHIAGLYELGPDYLATRYVNGPDVAHRMRAPISLEHALRLTLQIASALQHAHERGIIHRDVKPSNVVLDADADAHLVDFGVAVVTSAPEHDGLRVGTPSFWAPEQARGEAVGPAADQYGLARTLVAMLTGARPIADSRVALRALAESAPVGWLEILEKALAELPEARHASVGTFARALETAPRAALLLY